VDAKYREHARFFKVLSDPNRLMIVDMLSCGELCACVILEKFNITQPTLSHHMKSLCGSGLIDERKVGKWKYYSLNDETARRFKIFLDLLMTAKENCICHETKIGEGCCK